MKPFGQWQWLMGKNDWDIPDKKEHLHEEDFEMDHQTYIHILSHLQITQPSLRHYSQIPHPQGTQVLLNYTKDIATIKTGDSIGSIEPNNIIQYIRKNDNQS
ncbi:hypothetical protein O181_008419 [Austropuccinia psidii MF-1]|uniref:Uncharacterized protein n=1 Tax=Austropuccinia psidii MF-1 TaxID=1389203 RepID=A0A9Q3BMJ7_9BASI|nr:hypothetical protein [Austropuccinia psidii MF-1]